MSSRSIAPAVLGTHETLKDYVTIRDELYDSTEQRMYVEDWPNHREALKSKAMLVAKMLAERLLIPSFKHWDFHHLGYACTNIEREAAPFLAMGWKWDSPFIEDPLQGVRIRFMTGPGPKLELLEALEGSQPLTPWLEKGTKIYHQAFESPDFDGDLEALKANRCMLLGSPKPAVVFNNRRVAFAVLPNMFLIELIER